MIKALILICIGSIGMFIPRKWMTFGERWKYKGTVEPSDFNVLMNRLAGFVMALIGTFYILIKVAI